MAMSSTKIQYNHEIDFEGEEVIHRHPRYNIFCPRSYESVVFAGSANGREGRTSAIPINKPMTYYRQQLKMLTASIQLLQKNGDINVGALLQQYFARGFAHERLMEPDMAMKDYGTCLRLDSRFSPALYNRALLHYDMCEYQQALEHLTKLIAVEPRQPRYLELRARLLRKLGRIIPAGEDLEAARRIEKVINQNITPGTNRHVPRRSVASATQATQATSVPQDAPPMLTYMKRLTVSRRTKPAEVPAEVIAQRLMEKAPALRTAMDVKRISTELAKVACLHSLAKDHTALNVIAGSITLRRHDRDTYVFKTGDVGTAFLILYEGSIMITASSVDREILLKRLNRGDGFGEGVLYNPDRKRTANAFCDQESIVLALPLSVYVDVMNNVTDRMNLLSHCVMFRGWSEERRLAIANKMRPKQFDSNTTILRAGELVQELYIIKTGMARVLKRVPAALLRRQRPHTVSGRVPTEEGPAPAWGEPKREKGQEVPGFWTMEEDNWLDRDEMVVTDPLAVKSYELTVGVLGSCQVIGELCVLNPSTPSPVTIVAYTIIELYAVKKEELEAMGCAFDVSLTTQLNDSMRLHNPSSEKLGFLFRRKVEWERRKDALLGLVMPAKYAAGRDRKAIGTDAAKTVNTVILRQVRNVTQRVPTNTAPLDDKANDDGK